MTAPTPFLAMRGVTWAGTIFVAGLVLAPAFSRSWADDFQGATHLVAFDEGENRYSQARETNLITRLQGQLNDGTARLQFDDERGYLPSLLRELRVPSSSQMLVFSKTSLQRDHINPRNPRAIFFNDDVYLGFIPGAPMIEVSVADPRLGGVFYTLEQRKTDRPRLVRTDQCLECHASGRSMGVPGHLVRSSVTDDSGVVDLRESLSQVTQRTPFAERWGGWYVTGRHGNQPHRGNLIGPAAFALEQTKPNHAGNLDQLPPTVDSTRYPAATSDLVALMVLEHQTHLHNIITRLRYDSEAMLRQYHHVNYLHSPVEGFLRYCLFVDEAPLVAPVSGSAAFRQSFENLGPKDARGRSLRQFDLQTRLFAHPCSYLIYSEAFDSLPGPIKEVIFRRLWEIFTGRDTTDDFKSISPERRRAALEILGATKPGLPEYWKP